MGKKKATDVAEEFVPKGPPPMVAKVPAAIGPTIQKQVDPKSLKDYPRKAPKERPPGMTEAQYASMVASEPNGDREAAQSLLINGCPLCYQRIAVDTPVYTPGVPGLWPGVIFHFLTLHPGMPLPPPPNQEDDDLLDTTIVQKAPNFPPGPPRAITYREALLEAAGDFLAGIK